MPEPLPRLFLLVFPHFPRAVKTSLSTHAEVQQDERACYTIIALEFLRKSFRSL